MFIHVSQPLFADLSRSFLEQRDPVLVKEGLPAYLILLDGLIESNPKNKDLLLAAARSYSAYAGAFVEDPERLKLFVNRARDYAFRSMELQRKGFEAAMKGPYNEFIRYLSLLKKKDLPYLFHTASIWAQWIQTNSDSLDAIADLPRVRAMMERVIEIDDTYYYGAPHAFMGVLLSIFPPSLGGRPEKARVHFDKALALGGKRYIPSYVFYARYYARPLYKKELFFRLLQEASSIPVDTVPELTLINVLARDEARRLMEQALKEEYFD